MYLITVAVSFEELLSLSLPDDDGGHHLQMGGVRAHRHLDVLVRPPDEAVNVCSQMVLDVS